MQPASRPWRRLARAATAALVATLALGQSSLHPTLAGAAPGDPEISTPTSVAGEPGTTVTPFANGVVSGVGSMNGITLRITTGFNPSVDRMSMQGSHPGITATYNNATGLLRLRGTATVADYQAALRDITYFQTTPTETTRTFIVIAGTAIYLADTGNLYEYVPTGSSITWTDSRTAALSRTIGPFTGHLANLTSQAENDVAVIELQGNTWIGAADFEAEGVWEWMDGPEAGTQFWSGNSGGSPVGGRYSNWASGEPNNCCAGGEHYAHMFAGSGDWNDYPNSLNVQGYLVEYELEPSEIGQVASLVRLLVAVDTDSDGVSDDDENTQSTDPEDPNSVLDTDGDGVPDSVETADGTDPNLNTSFLDTDNDGVADYIESQNGSNPLNPDTDGDMVGDGTELANETDPADANDYRDTDGDGIPDDVETTQGTNPNLAGDALDTDDDGTPDYFEIRYGTDPNVDDAPPDTDGDGLNDFVEDQEGTNPVLADTDGDGVDDGDEVTQSTDPLDADSFLDTDSDGVPDAVEVDQSTDPNDAEDFLDTDSDGIADHIEGGLGTNPNDADSDNDGVNDGDEVAQSTNPLLGTSFRDTDADGVPDTVETAQGTSPTDADDFRDTDGDGVPDQVELANGTDPNDDEDFADTDNDGVPNYVEIAIGSDPADTDSDDDGVSDGDEVAQGSDPSDDEDFLDTDDDGVPDSVETTNGTDPNDDEDFADADDDGVPDRIEVIQGTDPNDDADILDTDDDGLNDYTEGRIGTDPAEADSDDDGVDDDVEIDMGLDPVDADTDGDSAPDGLEILQGTDPLDPLSFIDVDLDGISDNVDNLIRAACDRTIETQYTGTGAKTPIARLYMAYFKRQPDAAGLAYWTNLANGGMSHQAISWQFSQSAEFTGTYGTLDDAGFLGLVYDNVMCRAADADGTTYWLSRLTNRAMTRPELMAYFSDSAEFKLRSNT